MIINTAKNNIAIKVQDILMSKKNKCFISHLGIYDIANIIVEVTNIYYMSAENYDSVSHCIFNYLISENIIQSI